MFNLNIIYPTVLRTYNFANNMFAPDLVNLMTFQRMIQYDQLGHLSRGLAHLAVGNGSVNNVYAVGVAVLKLTLAGALSDGRGTYGFNNLPEQITGDKIVIHHGYEVVVADDVFDNLAGGRVGCVEHLPLLPELEGFVLPGEERQRVGYGRLDDLAVREDTPGDGIHRVGGHVGTDVTFAVDRGVGEDGLHTGGAGLDEVVENLVEDLGGAEEFDVGFLVDEAVGRSPADIGVGG